jgi:NAD(P)H-dependent FMN reductase/ketosteroid isomerase-like protein
MCSWPRMKTANHQPAQVAVLVGSLRAGSVSRKIARALIERAPQNLACRLVEIGDLPLYNEDLEQAVPPAWQAFRAALRGSQAVLFVTPEYNRSVPGCLKNALDVGSRPPKQSVFDGLPAAVVSVTPYKLGAFGANHALRQTFVFLNMPVLQQPEAYIGGAADLLNEAGQVKDAETDQFLQKFMAAFAEWIGRVRGGTAKPDFEKFIEQRREAASAYARGDAAPVAQIATRRDPATFFSPRGDALQGAAAIVERFSEDAKSFGKEGTTNLEILQSQVSGNLAFWTGLQHAEVGQGEKAKMTLRVTEVFRVEDGEFKLVHRHADPLKPPR